MTQETTTQTAGAQVERKPARKVVNAAALENQAARYQAARRVIDESGIKIVHMRLRAVLPEGIVGSHHGGMTIAYRQLETDSFIEIATAICSEKDLYDRKVGTILAVEQFDNQRRVRIPLFRAHPVDAIERLFGNYLTFTDGE